jgi:hypothetical protein
MKLSLPKTSTTPLVGMTSSTTKSAIASGLRNFQTASQKSSTILIEFMFFPSRYLVGPPLF